MKAGVFSGCAADFLARRPALAFLPIVPACLYQVGQGQRIVVAAFKTKHSQH